MPQSYPRSIDTDNGANGKRLPGRPRSEQSRQAILRSTLKFLRQHGGFPDLSIEAVAADAKVSKATVYRWWPTKAALVADAFSASVEQELQFPDTGSLRGDVAQQMRRVIRALSLAARQDRCGSVAGGQSDPELIEAFRERFMWPKRQQAYKTLCSVALTAAKSPPAPISICSSTRSTVRSTCAF